MSPGGPGVAFEGTTRTESGEPNKSEKIAGQQRSAVT